MISFVRMISSQKRQLFGLPPRPLLEQIVSPNSPIAYVAVSALVAMSVQLEERPDFVGRDLVYSSLYYCLNDWHLLNCSISKTRQVTTEIQCVGI